MRPPVARPLYTHVDRRHTLAAYSADRHDTSSKQARLGMDLVHCPSCGGIGRWIAQEWAMSWRFMLHLAVHAEHVVLGWSQCSTERV